MLKKILITTFTYPPQRNGVSHVVEAHATSLVRLGHDVTVLTSTISGVPNDSICDGVRVCRFAVQGSGLMFFGGYSGDIDGYQEFISTFEGDVIICHCWQIWTTNLAVKVFEGIDCKKILVSHGVSAMSLPSSGKGLARFLLWIPYVSKMHQMLLKFDHSVVLTDQKNLGSFYDHWLMHRKNYTAHSVIPNGVYASRFPSESNCGEKFRNAHQINDEKIILYVSNYHKRKNQQEAVEVFLELAPENTVLVLIGSEVNEYVKSMRDTLERAYKNGLRVILLEKQTEEEITEVYYAADLFLMTSTWELQPLVILEAMAASTPFISTDVGCVCDIPGGRVVRNRQEMVREVGELLENEAVRTKLGQEGRRAVESKYSWDQVAKLYDHLIQE